MGAVCAVVYLLVIIVFIPFPFYKDIVAATSGGGNRDVVFELKEVETGRLLHRFPHSKVRGTEVKVVNDMLILPVPACIVSFSDSVLTGGGNIRYRRRSLRYSMAS